MFKNVIKVISLTMLLMIGSFIYRFSVYNATIGGEQYQNELSETLKDKDYIGFKDKIYNLFFNLTYDGGVYLKDPLQEENVNEDDLSYYYQVDMLQANKNENLHNILAIYLYDIKLDKQFDNEIVTIKMFLEVDGSSYLVKFLEDVVHNKSDSEEDQVNTESYFLEFFEIAKKYEKGAKEPVDDTLYYLIYKIEGDDYKRDEEPTYIKDLSNAKLKLTYDVKDKELSEIIEITLTDMLPINVIITESDEVTNSYIDLYELNKGTVVKTVVIMTVVGVVIIYLMFFNSLVLEAIKRKKNPEIKERELLLQKKKLEEKRNEQPNNKVVIPPKQEDKVLPEVQKENLVEEVSNKTKEITTIDYSKMLVKDLRELAKEKGVEGYSTMLKKDLIETLEKLNK